MGFWRGLFARWISQFDGLPPLTDDFINILSIIISSAVIIVVAWVVGSRYWPNKEATTGVTQGRSRWLKKLLLIVLIPIVVFTLLSVLPKKTARDTSAPARIGVHDLRPLTKGYGDLSIWYSRDSPLSPGWEEAFPGLKPLPSFQLAPSGKPVPSEDISETVPTVGAQGR